MIIIEPAVQIAAFAVFAFVAIAGALGMATTMSMFRSGVFLMASFIGVAGLFILLLADLLALLQVMMYIGGMLVMILFMVLFSDDPGGEMMTGMMKLPPLEKFFSFGLAHKMEQGDHQEGDSSAEQHEKSDEEHGQNKTSGNQMDHDENGHDQHHGGGGHEDMSMTTPIKKPAAVLAVTVGLLLAALIVARPAWRVTDELPPSQDSPRQIGDLLMNKYMIAFEGAGLLILLGIFGAVFVSRPGQYSDSTNRDELQAAVRKPPAEIEADTLHPVFPTAAPQKSDDEESGA